MSDPKMLERARELVDAMDFDIEARMEETGGWFLVETLAAFAESEVRRENEACAGIAGRVAMRAREVGSYEPAGANRRALLEMRAGAADDIAAEIRSRVPAKPAEKEKEHCRCCLCRNYIPDPAPESR